MAAAVAEDAQRVFAHELQVHGRREEAVRILLLQSLQQVGQTGVQVLRWHGEGPPWIPAQSLPAVAIA